MDETESGTAIAPEPQLWVCSACGKRARSRYGFDRDGKSTAIDRGWDESCMLRAILCVPAPHGSKARWIMVGPEGERP